VWAVTSMLLLPPHPIPDITKFLLANIYGAVTAVNSDGSISSTRDFPAEPASAIATSEAGRHEQQGALRFFPDRPTAQFFMTRTTQR